MKCLAISCQLSVQLATAPRPNLQLHQGQNEAAPRPNIHVRTFSQLHMCVWQRTVIGGLPSAAGAVTLHQSPVSHTTLFLFLVLIGIIEM